jgi:hypothetical protein
MAFPDDVLLPLAAQTWAMHRIFVRQVSKGASSQWQLLPGIGRGAIWRPDAFHVLRYSRCALPQVGEAVFRVRYGQIDNQLIGSTVSNAFDPTTLRDLREWEVRIQAAKSPAVADLDAAWDATTQTLSASWRTVWHGWCQYQEDRLAPGGSEMLGERLYHCFDQHSRVKKWPLRRHAGTADGQTYTDCESHPGYNVTDELGRKLGNLDPSNTWDPNGDGDASVCYAFTFPGVGTPWSDRRAVEHALMVARGKGDAKLAMNGTTSLYSTTAVWKVFPDDSAGTLLERICRRQRGRGLVFYDWPDDTGGTGVSDLGLRLQVNPQMRDDLVVSPPTGSQTTFPGATTAGTTVQINLVGDHRNIADQFFLGSREDHRVDYLESMSVERIQVLATFSYTDNLEKRWSQTDSDAFEGLNFAKRIDAIWDHVYQVHGLKKAWQCQADDGNGKSGGRVDYRCGDDGTILTPSGALDTPPFMVKFLSTIPLYEGYDYQSTPVRKDGATETAAPTRRQPMILIRSDTDKFLDARTDAHLDTAVHGVEFRVRNPGDAGLRTVGDPSKSSLASLWKYDKVVWAGAIELPHRMRMASGDKNGCRKRRIFHRHLSLWLAHPQAIYAIDDVNRNDDGTYPVKRAASPGPAGIGILRDDREQLALLHALAVSWYGPGADPNNPPPERRIARWSLKACGFLRDFDNDPSGDGSSLTAVEYPRLGQFVTQIKAGGTIWDINTPITSVSYDNVTGITTWSTDWSDLDFEDGAH